MAYCEGDLKQIKNLSLHEKLKLHLQCLTLRQPEETFVFASDGRIAVPHTDATQGLVDDLRKTTRFDFSPFELGSALRQAFDSRDGFVKHDLKTFNPGRASETLILAPRSEQHRPIWSRSRPAAVTVVLA